EVVVELVLAALVVFGGAGEEGDDGEEQRGAENGAENMPCHVRILAQRVECVRRLIQSQRILGDELRSEATQVRGVLPRTGLPYSVAQRITRRPFLGSPLRHLAAALRRRVLHPDSAMFFAESGCSSPARSGPAVSVSDAPPRLSTVERGHDGGEEQQEQEPGAGGDGGAREEPQHHRDGLRPRDA